MRSKFIPLGNGENYVNTSTGEVIDDEGGFFAYVPRKSAFTRLYPKGWYAMGQDPTEALAHDEDLVGRPTQVLLYLLSKLNFDCEILVTQKEICDSLHLEKSQVSKIIKLLCDKEILLRGHKLGRTWSYKLNPTYGYKGDARGKVVSFGDGRNAFRVIEGGQGK